jgi:hypothetical protein
MTLEGSDYITGFAQWHRSEVVGQGNALDEDKLCKSALEPRVESYNQKPS